ncbi:MAG TPA: radical SAM protein [Vicinamibacterales bacterium]|nr:radical SAM protein [Vicinamibacterales bacterium]
MRTATYGAFSDLVHRAARSGQLPINGTFELTHRCPLVCAHCLNNLPMGDTAARDLELTREEHYRLLDELADAGCLWLLYTGGEIFARRDFLDIYTHAKQKGFLITLFTNGTLITPRVADHLVRWRPWSIEITMYGRTRETYERLTGVPGSFDKCMRGIDLLLERGLPLSLKTVAVSINQHELWDMQRFADDRGLEFKFDASMNPRIDCSHAPLSVRLTPEEVVGLDLQDPKRMNEWELFAEKNFKPANPPERQDELYYCGGGVDSFSIDPYGRMSICIISQKDKFDLRTGSVREGWEGFLRNVRRKKITRPTKCTECELKTMCSMCPAMAELENGDPEAPVDFLCRVAHLRAYAFGLPFGRHGDCEYCEGGAGYDEMMQTVARLKQLRPGERPSLKRRMLPIVQQVESGGCSTGGCAGCGAH